MSSEVVEVQPSRPSPGRGVELRSTSRETIIMAGLLAVGIALRAAWSIVRTDAGAYGEAFMVARAIAVGRGFADAYYPGQGPTAHLSPISPIIGGIVYRLFGINSPVSETILFIWASSLVFGAFLLLFRVFRRLGTPAWARIGGFAFLCLAPAYIGQESVDFRIWEGGLAVFLAALFLDRLLAEASIPDHPRGQLALLGAIAALLFFVNPPLGVGAYVAAAIFAFTRLRFNEIVFSIAFSAVALAALIVPWTVRNELALHEFIPLRSNAGTELALANHPAAVSGQNPSAVFEARMREIHPSPEPDVLRRMQAAGGEAGYSRMLGQETKDWMIAHPRDEATLVLRHLRQIFAPDPWMFAAFGTGNWANLRAALTKMIGVGGLAGLLLALWRRRRNWIYPAALVAGPAVALAFFQPVPRYTYLFWPLLTFCAADLLATLFERFARRRTVNPSPAPQASA